MYLVLRHELFGNECVQQIASQLGVEPDLVIGKLCRLWSWAAQSFPDGVLVNTAYQQVDELAGLPGLAQALVAVGWAEQRLFDFHLLEFDRYNAPEKLSKVTVAVDGVADSADGFDAFWEAYPRKVARAAALKAWRQLRPSQALRTKIMQGLEAVKKTKSWQGAKHYIPHASTWLNGQRWNDDLSSQEGLSVEDMVKTAFAS